MKQFFAMALIATIAAPVVLPTAAQAQRSDYRWNGDRDGDWDPSRHYQDRRDYDYVDQNARVYRGSDGRYYCKKSNGTTGLLLGAVGGGLIGSAIGGSTLGTILGAGGGALLGRSLDKQHDTDQNRRNGYVCH
jgi:hypothetical protein